MERVVAKFGGSSVKDGAAMLRCSNIIENNNDIKIVVISATQNTTNQLEKVAGLAKEKKREELDFLLSEIMKRHNQIANEIFSGPHVFQELNLLYDEMKKMSEIIFDENECRLELMDQLYSIGERISSLLMFDLLRLRIPEKEIILMDAGDVIKTNSDYQKAKPEINLIAEAVKEKIIPFLNSDSIIVTQGFIGKDFFNKRTTLGREGSDYSAALLGEAIDASLVQIWTDVPGIASSDPRIVKDARFIPRLSYDEATAMASLGAKVLFPTTLLPTKRKKIPVWVGSSLDSSQRGTLVTNDEDSSFKLKGVSLMERINDSLLSFIGCHLNQEENLALELKLFFQEENLGDKLELWTRTSTSISFKIDKIYASQLLTMAHKILLTKY